MTKDQGRCDKGTAMRKGGPCPPPFHSVKSDRCSWVSTSGNIMHIQAVVANMALGIVSPRRLRGCPPGRNHSHITEPKGLNWRVAAVSSSFVPLHSQTGQLSSWKESCTRQYGALVIFGTFGPLGKIQSSGDGVPRGPI